MFLGLLRHCLTFLYNVIREKLFIHFVCTTSHYTLTFMAYQLWAPFWSQGMLCKTFGTTLMVYAKFPESFLFFVEFPRYSLIYHQISSISQSVKQRFQKFSLKFTKVLFLMTILQIFCKILSSFLKIFSNYSFRYFLHGLDFIILKFLLSNVL